ncbi:ABC transporter permease [Geodermatophilus sp. CPCC 205506]|uniref:ABC transporter permease n=1 Tax=Geodermatophilus sp. CPCC 205506 TaxID=2936596 RepID=UPI003EE9074D
MAATPARLGRRGPARQPPADEDADPVEQPCQPELERLLRVVGAELLAGDRADLGSSVLGLAMLVAAAFAIGWRPGGGAELLAAVGLLLLLRLAFLWMGVHLGLLTRDPATVTAVQILVWPFAILSNAFVPASTMPGWLGTVAEWNPLAATVTAVRDLFGQPGDAGGGWATEHALLLAVVWPVALTALFAALSVRRWQTLSR